MDERADEIKIVVLYMKKLNKKQKRFVTYDEFIIVKEIYFIVLFVMLLLFFVTYIVTINTANDNFNAIQNNFHKLQQLAQNRTAERLDGWEEKCINSIVQQQYKLMGNAQDIANFCKSVCSNDDPIDCAYTNVYNDSGRIVTSVECWANGHILYEDNCVFPCISDVLKQKEKIDSRPFVYTYNENICNEVTLVKKI